MNYIIAKQFWSCVETDRNRAIIINSTATVFERVTPVAGILTILTGFAMVAILHGVVGSQLWFRIKMILVLMIILNLVHQILLPISHTPVSIVTK